MEVLINCALCPMQASKYVWLTYQEVYNNVIQIGAALRAVGVQPVSFCSLNSFL